MDKKTVPLVILAIALCAVIVLGEVLTYSINTHSFDAKAEFSSNTLDYSVSSSGSDTYSVVLLDNDDEQSTKALYVYINERYDDFYKQALEKSNVRYVEQQYYSEQVKKFLGLRGFDDVTLIGTEQLIELLNDPGTPKGKGLLITSFALPSEVYSGHESDALLQWIKNGGNLYWSSSEIGRFYTDSDGLHEVTGNQTLFFGKECVNTGELVHATSAVDNSFREAFTLMNSGLEFAVNTDGITDSLSIGYCDDGYSSISFVKHGNGMICVIGSMSEIIPQLDDTAQIIASGLTYSSRIVETVSGNVIRGTVEGKIDYTVTNDAVAYIYIGGTYTVYGRCFVDQ
ncbi:MAG: hypothetical protein J5813_03535 [Candidatus Methanomethylophilaceae archaeon]|nr:hypothetical protein [Candidatus Methanomethylophilaceae archaeon]